MSFIVSIETATKVCSVALHENGNLCSIRELDAENAHSQNIIGFIDQVLKERELAIKDLSAVAVSAGPGSYTGLRIGVSVAKGLAFASKIPLISIGTLEALGSQVFSQAEVNSYVIPMIDARRMEVYGMVFNDKGETIVPAQPFLLEENPFQNLIDKGRPLYFLGDGSEKAKSKINSSKAIFLPNLNSANAIGELAFKKFSKKEFVELAYFEPNYLKEYRVLTSTKNPLLI
jgi:tRNA threonylcarbamoyladenosine biosynthesis protein TsaB